MTEYESAEEILKRLKPRRRRMGATPTPESSSAATPKTTDKKNPKTAE